MIEAPGSIIPRCLLAMSWREKCDRGLRGRENVFERDRLVWK